jgi:hypothetical protein
MPEPTFSPEAEMRELLARFEAKRHDAPEAAGDARELFRETLAEHVAVVAPTAAPAAAAPADVASQPAVPPDVEPKLDHLVQVAMAKGIGEAVREAEGHGDPYLISQLHARLVDSFYQKLVDAGQIMP